MEIIGEIIQNNSSISIAIGMAFIFIACFIFRKIKILAIILIIFSTVVFYFLMHSRDIDKTKVIRMKQETKEKMMKKISK